MKFDRTRRIGEEIRKELAHCVATIINHPRASLLSFTAVHLTRDLAFAKVYVTHVVADNTERTELMQALNDKAGIFRHQLAKTLSIRKVPELKFVYDESIEYGARMNNLLTSLVKNIRDEENLN